MSVDETLRHAVRHNTWANLELLASCVRLSPDELAWTAPGTYGTLHSTLHHIVGSEHGYLAALTGELPPIEVEGRGRPLTPDWQAPLNELLERARSNGERLERVLDGGFDPARLIARKGRNSATAAIIVTQFLHHGSDHRAQIATILGGNGVQAPPLDAWAYGRVIGDVAP